MTTLDNDLPERPLFLRVAQLVGHHKTRVWTAYVAFTVEPSPTPKDLIGSDH